MNRGSDIGENLAIVIVVGLTVVTPLLFTAWLVRQAITPASVPAVPPKGLAVMDWKQSISETIRLSLWGNPRH